MSNKIGVLGAGTMGRGIAQVALEGGLNVLLVDVAESAITHAVNHIDQNWEKAISKERMTPEKSRLSKKCDNKYCERRS